MGETGFVKVHAHMLQTLSPLLMVMAKPSLTGNWHRRGLRGTSGFITDFGEL